MIERRIKLFLVFWLVNILATVIVLNIFYKPKRIVVLDMQSIVSEYIQNKASGDYDEKEAEKFISKIYNLVNQIVKTNKLIIVPKQAVFGGEDMDITEQFREALKNVK